MFCAYCTLLSCVASSADYQLGGAAPVSASAVPVGDGSVVFTPRSEACPFPTPRALQLDEIPGLVQQFVDAARNAIAAGFHGVEVRPAAAAAVDAWCERQHGGCAGCVPGSRRAPHRMLAFWLKGCMRTI